MELTDIPVERLMEALWNANLMDEAMLMHLRESIARYGLVENLVVRRLSDNCYETLSGNQRLKLLKEAGVKSAPCLVVDLDDAHARLLAQALNHLRGQDDLGMRAESLREVLKTIPEAEVMAVLPDTAEGLRSLASMGQETMAAYLQNWQQAQAAKLRHLQFQLTPRQLEVVEKALSRVLPMAKENRGDSPNPKGTALYLLCKSYLERNGGQ